MATYAIHGTNGEGPDRKRLLTCLNTGTSTEATWSILGYHVTESDIEYDNEVESDVDIRGNTFITAKTASMTQTLSGPQIVAGDAVANHIVQIAVIEKDAGKLTNQDVLVIHDYLRDTTEGA